MQKNMMNKLEIKLKELNPGLYSNFLETLECVELLLGKYDSNFVEYTDHSILHTKEVFKIASELMETGEIGNLNADEIYILSMACILHDIGMCIPEKNLISDVEYGRYKIYKQQNPYLTLPDLIRDIHHELSYDFIQNEYQSLKIPSAKYAEAIAKVAKGHRKVALDDPDFYPSKFFVRNGRDFVCLPFLAAVLRLSDELDITNIRTPALLTKYYMPNSEKSIMEWKKHIATTQINFTEDKVLFHVTCSDHNNLAALEAQFDKIQNVSNYCQKIVRTISNTENRFFLLKTYKIEPLFTYEGFDPKGIKFTFNVENVVNTFIGYDLYENELAGIREALQNSIDSCKYKMTHSNEKYIPKIDVWIKKKKIIIEDNGIGMDDFVIENFFGRLGSSFYEQPKVKKNFEAIGQFGVGVFSYFMLSDYIDIETKTEHGKALKFRIDKDPKSYFHFFSNQERTEPGTTVSLHLKDEVYQEFSFNEYVNYIKEQFRYTGINITIKSKDVEIPILDRTFSEMENSDYLKKRMFIHFRDRLNEVQTIPYSIFDDQVHGQCAIIVPKIDDDFNFLKISKYFDSELFNSRRGHNSSEISICQKGVYVNSYSAELIGFTIGSINLIQSKKINIKRDDFTYHIEIERIISQFIVGALRELFILLNSKFSAHDLAAHYNHFFATYLRTYFNRQDDYTDYFSLFQDYAYVRFHSNGKDEFILLSELPKRTNKFILVSDLELIEDVWKQFQIPILVAYNYGNLGSFDELRNIITLSTEFIPTVIINDNCAYQLFDKDALKVDEDEILSMSELIEYEIDQFQLFESGLIAVTTSFNKICFEQTYRYDVILNMNHPYIEFLLENFHSIYDNPDYQLLSQRSFSIITDICENGASAIYLEKLNKTIAPFAELGLKISFSTKDFQLKN